MNDTGIQVMRSENMTENDFYLLSSGQALLETLKYASQILWFKEKHFTRLAENAADFNIQIDPQELEKKILSKIEKKGKGHQYRVRIILMTSFTDIKTISPKMIIQLLPLTASPQTHAPVRLMLQKTPYAYNPLARIKTINYGPLLYHKRKAIEQGFDDVLFYDETNRLLEASTSNIFGVKNEKIITPPVNDLLLPGTIREIICEHMEVIEQPILTNEISGFDFFFLTNAITEITIVSRINDYQFNLSKKGQMIFLKKWEQIKSENN